MIKIEFEAANGADLRKEMLALLGLSNELKFKASVDTADLKIALNDAGEELKNLPDAIDTTNAEETPKPEQTTRKRRSKAEIEAEAALATNTGTEETQVAAENATASEEVSDMNLTLAQDNADQNAVVTADDLTKKCVELGRAGKRDAVLAVFETQFGGATISKKDGKPQLTADQYPAAMEALNAIA